MDAGQALDPKATQWYSLLRDRALSYSDLLANLHNILLHAPACTQLACEQLVDPMAIQDAHVLPFRYLDAITDLVAFPGEAVRDVLMALAHAADLAVINVPVLPGKTLIGLDCTGSMSANKVGGKQYRCMDLASLFAATLYKSQEADLFLFGTKLGVYNPPKSVPVTAMAQDLARRDMGATRFDILFDAIQGAAFYDRLLILSDAEAQASMVAAETAFRRFRERHGPRPEVFVFDLSRDEGLLAPEVGLCYVHGFPEPILEVLKEGGRYGQARA